MGIFLAGIVVMLMKERVSIKNPALFPVKEQGGIKLQSGLLYTYDG